MVSARSRGHTVDLIRATLRDFGYADAMANEASGDLSPEGGFGVCDRCRHQRLVASARGSTFSLCLRSRDDPDYPRYPRTPLEACGGYESREDDDS